MKLRFSPRASLCGLLVLVVLACFKPSVEGQIRSRRELFFPDLPGMVTLRCDLHIHTVFSDGNVWPTTRVEEAWRDGLDCIATTDHIEYLPHKKDIPTSFGRAYELAKPVADAFGILLIRAAELTRSEPPGHWNALFVTNETVLDQANYRVAVSNAIEQGAFVFWNHPGWKQPELKPVWYAEQEDVFTNGWLHGIEVVNGPDYYPLAHGWCQSKRLAMLGNSDVHDPIQFDYPGKQGEIRPMTLVFARERTVASVREALFAQRSVVFAKGRLYGNADYLAQIFRGSIEVLNPNLQIRGKGSGLVQIRNKAPLPFELRLNPKLPELDVASQVVLQPGAVTTVPVSCASDRVTGDQSVGLPCRVLNLLVAPEKPLSTTLVVSVRFQAEETTPER